MLICDLCGKAENCINPLRRISVNPLICSPECLQAFCDKNGLSFNAEGVSYKVAPGNVKITINPDIENNEITVDFTWEKIDEYEEKNTEKSGN